MAQAEWPQQRLLQSVELGTLLACYGGLLTPKQREALHMHCGEDLTLAEIADVMGVSRQNVHELITRSEQKLRRYESALHLAAQANQTRQALADAIAALDDGQVAMCRQTLTQLMQVIDEEEPESGV